MISYCLSPISIYFAFILSQDFEAPPTEHVPRVLPKNEDPRLVNRNKRMLGQLLGTLEVWSFDRHFNAYNGQLDCSPSNYLAEILPILCQLSSKQLYDYRFYHDVELLYE